MPDEVVEEVVEDGRPLFGLPVPLLLLLLLSAGRRT